MQPAPAWFAQPAAAAGRRVRQRSDGIDAAQPSQGRGRASGAGGNDIAALVEVTAKLALSTSQSVREIESIVLHTYMKKGEDVVTEALKEAGATYHQQATDLKSKKEEALADGSEPPDMAGLGSPHLHAWPALVKNKLQKAISLPMCAGTSWTIGTVFCPQ